VGDGRERKAAGVALAVLLLFWVALVVVPNAIPAVDALARLVPSWVVGSLLLVVVLGPAASYHLRRRRDE
jgi:hypothetical protein